MFVFIEPKLQEFKGNLQRAMQNKRGFSVLCFTTALLTTGELSISIHYIASQRTRDASSAHGNLNIVIFDELIMLLLVTQVQRLNCPIKGLLSCLSINCP